MTTEALATTTTKPTNGKAKVKAKGKEAPQTTWRFRQQTFSSTHARLSKVVGDLLVAVHAEGQTPLPHKTEELTIRPETARSWLKRNKRNRPVSIPLVRFLMREIEEGRWIMNGQSISFKANGDLNDGQHRLVACALTGQPIISLVAVNIREDAFTTVDTGRMRRAPDILALAGYTHNPSALASAIRWDATYEREQLSWKMKRPHIRLSNKEILEIAERKPWLAELANRYYSQKHWVKIMPASLFVFVLGRLQQIDRAAAEEFFANLARGANLSEKSPILFLRERLLEDRSLDRRRAEEAIHLGFIVKTWNAWYQGKTIDRFSFRREDKFPDFVTVPKDGVLH